MFTILIVEDNDLLREVLHDTLHSHFLFPAMATAASVAQARATIDAVHPDVIFLDIGLPDGNGLELTRRLRAEGINARIAVLTSHDLPEYRDEALRSGADHFLVKGSASLNEIFGVVETAIASRFRVLIVTEDASFKDRATSFVSTSWPDTVVALAAVGDEALEAALVLKPNLVMLQSAGGAEQERGFCEQMRSRCAGFQSSVVSVRDADVLASQECPADYCVPIGAEFGDKMATIIISLRDSRSVATTY